MVQGYSVFISAVTREFGAARDALANALQARGIDVKVQRSFGLDYETLAKLHDHIRRCDRVIAVIGTYSGMFPPDGAMTDEFRAMLPPGMNRASLTQWEVIFARHYGRQTYFFEAAGYEPEQPPSDDDDQAVQAAWRDWLFDDIGRDRRQFRSADGLRADVMELDWPKLAPPKPSNLPGSIGHLFKGREGFLGQLRESFISDSAAITGRAVHGLGGVGKTRAAIEYGHDYADEYAATIFLNGKSENDLRLSLAALADAAVLDLPGQHVSDLDARLAAVIGWLRANPDWLLIIDNVDDEAAATAVRAFLDDLRHGEGHVLVTGRASDWGHMVESLELDPLSHEAAKDLLRESTPHRMKRFDEDAALAQLVGEKLGGLPLALALAAAFINERRISFADYAILFEANAEIVAELEQPLPHAIGLRFDDANCLRYDPTANAETLARDQDAVDRHAECRRLARKWRDRCRADIGGNSAAELIEQCDLFVDALSDSIDSMRPMLVVMRFVTLEELLKSQEDRDASSDVVALPDGPLSDLRILVRNAGIFIALDNELAATYRADPGSGTFAPINPGAALRLVASANRAGLTDSEVRVIIEVEVKQAESPNADPAASQRLARDASHVVRRLLGRIMAASKGVVKNAKNIETIGGWIKSGWQWIAHHQNDLLTMFPEWPQISAWIREIVRSFIR